MVEGPSQELKDWVSVFAVFCLSLSVVIVSISIAAFSSRQPLHHSVERYRSVERLTPAGVFVHGTRTVTTWTKEELTGFWPPADQ